MNKKYLLIFSLLIITVGCKSQNEITVFNQQCKKLDKEISKKFKFIGEDLAFFIAYTGSLEKGKEYFEKSIKKQFQVDADALINSQTKEFLRLFPSFSEQEINNGFYHYLEPKLQSAFKEIYEDLWGNC